MAFYMCINGNNAPVTSSFRFLKWHITASKYDSDYIQMSKIEFLDSSENLYVFSNDVTATVENGRVAGSDVVVNITDGNVTDKCCVYWSKDYVDLIIDLKEGSELDISTFTQFKWYTGNDLEERDPSSWMLYGANLNTFEDSVLLNQEVAISAPSTRQSLGYTGNLRIH